MSLQTHLFRESSEYLRQLSRDDNLGGLVRHFDFFRMPPAIPLYTFDVVEKAKNGICNTRSGMYFAEVNLRNIVNIPDSDLSEFGSTLYGPLRSTASEAATDFKYLNDQAHLGTQFLRRAVAKLGYLGGTKSHPGRGVKSVLAGAPKIHISMTDGDSVEIRGIRRPNVSVAASPNAPQFVLSRVIDLITDLLSCAVDSQLGIAPSANDLVEAVKHAITRERGACPISEGTVSGYILPLVQRMMQTEPWSSLREARKGTDDAEVIHGLMNQFLDKSRQADEHGERKQVKRLRKEVRDRKKTAHTVFVSNLPAGVTEETLFNLVNSVNGEKNNVYKVKLPRDENTGSIKSYAFVTCRSKKATEAVLAHGSWILGDKKLYVAPRNEDDASPSIKHQKTGDLPIELQREILRAVKSQPGCNVSQIPDLVSKGAAGLTLNPQAFGFRNLTHALQSVATIRLEPKETTVSHRPVYYAYPN